MGSNPVRDAISFLIMLIMVALAVLEDADCVFQLHASCFNAVWNFEYFQHALSDNRYICLKALYQSEIVGFCLCLNIPPEIEILSIGVREEARKNGYGKMLLKYLIKNYAFEKIFLEVSKNNNTAIKLYESVGFKKISERRGYYHEDNEYVDALIYQLINI